MPNVAGTDLENLEVLQKREIAARTQFWLTLVALAADLVAIAKEYRAEIQAERLDRKSRRG
jgi:hypothetical protein